jgi:hypothetical protein
VKFKYLPLPTRQPIFSLGGIRVRYRPIVPIRLTSPLLLPPMDGCIDSATDDTIFPQHLALRLGIDLKNAPQGEARPAGHGPLPVLYSRVTLLLTDGFEICEWEAIVGFVAVHLRWLLLGQAGFLEFFDSELLGARREVILTPNSSFQGKHRMYGQAPP